MIFVHSSWPSVQDQTVLSYVLGAGWHRYPEFGSVGRALCSSGPASSVCVTARGDHTRYKLLGKTGLRVSGLCFGAMIFDDEARILGRPREEAGLRSRPSSSWMTTAARWTR